MKYAGIGSNNYIIRLEKGEEIIASLKKFCATQQVDNAYFLGLGSVENPKLAHYLVATKAYTETEVKGVFELLSITGNIALFEDAPLIHAHVSLSDDQMQSRGGHLVSASVSATVEIHLTVLDSVFTKSMNEEIGLKLFDLPEEVK